MTQLLSELLLVMLLVSMIAMSLSSEERACKKSYDCDGWSHWRWSCCVGGKCETKGLFENRFCENDRIENLEDYIHLCECMGRDPRTSKKRECPYGDDLETMISRCRDFVVERTICSKHGESSKKL